MFIISNGAYKSGSTWLYLILEELLKIKKINFNRDVVEEWRKESNPNFLFSDETVEKAIERYTQENLWYLSMVNLLEESSYEAIANNTEDIRILFIQRDIGDAIVSHYHHLTTETRINLHFSIYYWLLGRYKAMEIESFEENRVNYLPNALSIKFEDLKTSFHTEVGKIADYLGINITKEEKALIQSRTSIDNLRKKARKGKITQYSSDKNKAAKHFRKGDIGESKNVLTDKQRQDLKNITEGNFTKGFELYYNIAFKLRRKIYKI
jgi:hypothetical protein